MCAFIWVSVHKTWVKGTSVWALFYWKCHAFIGTWVLFFCREVLREVINEFVKYNQALKQLNCIFILFLDFIKCIWFIHDMWPFSHNLIVYFYSFALVLFQIVKIINIIINHIYIVPIHNTSFYGTLLKTKLYINFITKITLNLRHNYD